MTTSPESAIPTYAPEEITTDAPTRSARLKWAIIVNNTLASGLVINAVACISATTGTLVDGLNARGGPDATGYHHPGLPWAGCTVLSATPDQLSAIQGRAVTSAGVLVVDMPTAAQSHRIYDDYLGELATTPLVDTFPCAISIIGPRNRIDKMTKGLDLVG